jgi:hypothetical protein
MAEWYAPVCKTVYPGSIMGAASINLINHIAALLETFCERRFLVWDLAGTSPVSG